ncbi:fuculose phosphate aldolase [Brucella endophytica]|uniref:Fuculose phosphate aldolase n=1 Tax=Brucella endophytica TaxID=1963359 RepID=A0A916S7I5_9HYPH|nr:class II aldolase/adducin family protein [Brucella endophytica]GGA87085.1 fuculose phosphate aldolase [Brucella endophytica]
MASFMRDRQEIADMCRALADSGYLAGTGGNIGLRLDDRLMAVTPSATDYYAMRAEDVVILEIETLAVVEGEKPPTIEKGLHARMLAAYPSRRASIHTHQPIASAVALLHETLPWPVVECPSPLPSPRTRGEGDTGVATSFFLPGAGGEKRSGSADAPLSPSLRGEGKGEGQLVLGRHVALIPYRPSGTGMLVKALTKALRPDVFAYLLASHGVICAGTDLSAAADMIRKIEAAAAHHLRERIRHRTDLDTRLQAFVLDTLEKAQIQGSLK